MSSGLHFLDDRQVIQRAALSTSIGSAANTTLDVLFTTIDGAMVNITGNQTISGAKTFTFPGTAINITASTTTLTERINNTNSAAQSLSQLRLLNDASRAFEFQYYSSGTTAAQLTNGPSGEQGVITTTGSFPLTIGTSGTAAININSSQVIGIVGPNFVVENEASFNGLVGILGTHGTAQFNIDGTSTITGNTQIAEYIFFTATGSGVTSPMTLLQGQYTQLVGPASVTVTNAINYQSVGPTPGSGGSITRFTGFYEAGAAAENASHSASFTDNDTFTSNYFINQSATTFPSVLNGNLTLSSGSSLIMDGSSSGAVTINVGESSGTTTSYNFNLPTTGAGTSGQVLASGGGGTTAMTWATVAAFSGFTTDGVMYASAPDNIASTAAGTTGQILSAVTSSPPVWSSAQSLGLVTQVNVQTFSTGTTYTFTINGTLTSTVDAGTTYTNNGNTYTVTNTTASGSTTITATSTSGNLIFIDQLQLGTSTGGTPPSTISFNYAATSFTYTPTTGMVYCTVECVGGGGGGGGSGITSASETGAAGGGGGAGYCRKTFPSSSVGASQAILVGLGGSGGEGTSSPTIGGSGGTSSFGSLISSTGGAGGTAGGAAANPQYGPGNGGGVGGTTTGTVDVSIQGDHGNFAFFANTAASSGYGGSTPLGFGGEPQSGGSGVAGTGYGSGSSGAVSNPSNGSGASSASGQAGIIIVTEYIA